MFAHFCLVVIIKHLCNVQNVQNFGMFLKQVLATLTYLKGCAYTLLEGV